MYLVCLEAVVDAGLSVGLRHFDSASFYNNEAGAVMVLKQLRRT